MGPVKLESFVHLLNGEQTRRGMDYLSCAWTLCLHNQETKPRGESFELVRHRARVRYDGTRYKGWQLQDKTRLTIQGQLESAMGTRARQLVRVVGASRTDTGVHARGQVIHFDLPRNLPDFQEDGVLNSAKFGHAINRMLPDDIRISAIEKAPNQGSRLNYPWCAIHSAMAKRYSYRIYISKELDPLRRLYCYWVGRPFEREVLFETLCKFQGTFNFGSFACGPPRVDPVRTIFDVDFIEEDDEAPGGGSFVRVDFVISGALYRMMRNIVGTSLEVAMGRLHPSVISELLESGKRDGRTRTAPAHGLCLEQVWYPDNTVGLPENAICGRHEF